MSDVAIIGGGPSGVAAALELRRRGLTVTLLERETHLGGATRHCAHSPFGMREFGRVYFGKAYGQRLEAEVDKAGVELRYRQSVTRIAQGLVEVATPAGLERIDARTILVATGAREKPRSARLLPGDRPVGVITTGTLQSMIAFQHRLPFRNPLILGSELVTLSAVLTCRSHSIWPVAVVEPLEKALAPAPLSWFPAMLGIPFYKGIRILDILGKGRVQAVRILRGGQEEVIACDGLLLTGRFTPEATLLQMSGFELDPATGGPRIDQTGRLAEGVHAAGNLLRPVESGGWAYREGRTVARAIGQDGGEVIPVTYDTPLRYVVPSLLRRSVQGMTDFQLRVSRPVSGEIGLELDGQAIIRLHNRWKPERRILLPLPPQALQASTVHIAFREGC